MDWQISILTWFQSLKNPVFDVFFVAITMTAEELFVITIAAWLMWCQNKRLAQRVGFAFLTSTVFNPTLKSFFAIDRPIGVTGIESLHTETAPGYAFPSGHTQGATTFWLSIALFMKRPRVTALAITMISLVAISRMYLGVHWLTDVAGGIFFGLLWVLFVDRVFSYAEEHQKQIILWLLILPFFVPYFIYDDNKPLVVSLGASLGFLAGYMLEDRYIQFKVNAKVWQQILKMTIGLGVFVLIKVGLKPILIFPEQISDLIRYAAIGFWLTAGAPYLFRKIGWG